MDIYLTNSLTRKKEKFIPIKKGYVGMYTCGPTVYDYATIGNFRTYTIADILYRVLVYNGYKVDYIMNLTDVGHLTGDNSGDASTGEDRLEKSAKKEGKTAWDIAKFYIDAFLADFKKLNLTEPKMFVKATDHIKEQIDLVKILEQKGFTYNTSDGVYFDTQAFEKKTGKIYGVLSNLKEIKEGARVEINHEKRDPRDFALWKFSPTGEKRQMEWDSPWGIGFPGWHIECSAMSMKYLGDTFDIHAGGEDLRSTHHPNEIAQSEAATGKKFVNYWIHGTFLKVDGKRMGKSVGNAYTISDIIQKGFDPMALRYLYLTSHYSDNMNFTWQGLEAASKALDKIHNYQFSITKEIEAGRSASNIKPNKTDNFSDKFNTAINNDLNTSEALAVMWEMLKSNMPAAVKSKLLTSFDSVLGLELDYPSVNVNDGDNMPDEIRDMIKERENLRKAGDFEGADKLRLRLKNSGFETKDQRI